MKTKTLLQTLGLTALLQFVTIGMNAQIHFEGFQENHEGIAIWDANGSGPEAEAYGHAHPFGWELARYYATSVDYDDIDPSENAAMGHLIDNISGFPHFEQALIKNGYTPEEVKIKSSLFTLGNDIEGEDWFTFNDMHYYNRYNGYIFLELSGEPMIKIPVNYLNHRIKNGAWFWLLQSNYTPPIDSSENSSYPVKEVAIAFLKDMSGYELRVIFEDIQPAFSWFGGNGRENGAYLDIHSARLEKGFSKLSFTGLESDNEGLAGWDADGSGPEPEADGHYFIYGGYEWWMAYYVASRDYDDIDADPNAALAHFTGNAKGFPNLEIQLAYRGYLPEQLKLKSGLSTLGNNIERQDWGIDGNNHWYRHYDTPVTIEIDGEPIFEYVVDTNYGSHNLDEDVDWISYTSYDSLIDVSNKSTNDAQFVAAAFMKDMGNHLIKSFMEGHLVSGSINSEGRTGVYHEISNGYITYGYPDTSIIDGFQELVQDLELILNTSPNPFSKVINIEFQLQNIAKVEVSVYNQLGQMQEVLAQKEFRKGTYQLNWQPSNQQPGIYFIRLKANNSSICKKVIKVK